MLGESVQTVREKIEFLIKASNDIGLEINSEKNKYMITYRQQNIVQIQNGSIVIENSFQNVENFKYL